MQKFFIPALLLLLSACASAPNEPESGGVTFNYPVTTVRQAAVRALSFTGFEIEKNEPNYLEAYRNRKVGFFVGSGGETVGVWLKQMNSNMTSVRVATQKSFVGYVGQKDWSGEIVAEMKKELK